MCIYHCIVPCGRLPNTGNSLIAFKVRCLLICWGKVSLDSLLPIPTSYKSYAVIFRLLLLTLTFWMIGKMTQEGKTQILTLHEACIAWKEILEHTSQSKTVISGLPKKARGLPLGQTPPLAPVSGCPRKTTPATDKLKEARS